MSDDVATALRAWLRRRPEPADHLVSVLAYELVALIALHSIDEDMAREAITAIAAVMFDQVAEFGVDGEHP